MGRNSPPINVIVYYPKTEEGKKELADRIAGIHADAVGQHVQRLNCPREQKVRLIDRIIAISAQRDRQEEQQANLEHQCEHT